MEEESTAANQTSPAAPAESRKRRVWKFPHNWKEVRALGWKMILAFILFYLIRDSILYILLPYLAYKGIFN